MFIRLAGQREDLAWLKLAFLFTITIMPFTATCSAATEQPARGHIFAVNLLLASLATLLTLELGRRRGLLVVGPARRGPGGRSDRAVTGVAVILVVPSAWPG